MPLYRRVHAALSAVRLFIEQHGDSRFEPLQNALPRPVNNRAGWRKGEGVDRRWLIPKEVWKSEICAGQDPTFVARTLAERGMLLRASDGFQRVENIEGRSMRVYVVTAALMSEPDCG